MDKNNRNSDQNEPISDTDYDVLHVAISFSTDDLLRKSITTFRDNLSSELGSLLLSTCGEELLSELISKKTFSNSDSPRKILLQPLAHDVMSLLWRESPYIDVRALEISGYSKVFASDENQLTRFSLANEICGSQADLDVRDMNRLKRTIDRICDALEVFELLDRTEVRPNFKPIQGTERLHSIMTRSTHAVAQLYQSQLRPK